VTHKGGWQLVGAAPSVPLGLGSTPEPVQGVLTPGDRMLLFTDGLLEARHPDGTFIDPEPLWSLAVTEPFPVLLDTVLGSLQSWTGGRLQDDLALLSIQYPGALEPRHVTAGTDPSAQRLTRVLPPETASVGVARRLVGRLLEETGRQGMVDDAQTAVSELMTNALVHTGSDIHLVATVTGSGLRVEIGDASPHAPLRRDYAATSATGRGLRIVEDVVTRWSSFPLGTGKVVWFEMEDPSGQPFATREPPPPATSPDQKTVEVELQNVPLLMHAAWQEHTSALLREYLLVKVDEDMSVMGTHAAASDAMNLLYEQIPLPALGDDPEMIMSGALEPHVSQPTLVLGIPQSSVHHFEVLDTMIREALELADTDRMFVPPTQPEIRDMCRWLCREVLEQAELARPPRPWSPREPVQVTHVPELTVPGFDPAEVTSSSRGLLVANEASVIVAVSPSMVEFLGYGSAAELVGRPLISVVPHRYRQAHVAGTTLHSVNGREPLLDVPLTVPVLRADGDESAVDLRVVSRSLPTGRRVFVAEFSLDRETGPAGGS
jgi:PAS domain S-box-containing protein